MRMMMRVSIPVETGNEGIKKGSLAKTVTDFVKKMKPEACYFTTDCGDRTAYFVFDMKDSTLMPTVAEPFFMNLCAGIDYYPVMNLDDLKAGLAKLGK